MERFRRALISQFGPMELEDSMGALIKIHMFASVAEYHKQVIKMSQFVENILQEHLVSCFVAWLKDGVRQEASYESHLMD